MKPDYYVRNVTEQSHAVIAAWLEWFPEKSRLCRNDQVCQGVKEALYRSWCGANRLGDGGVHTLGDNSAFVNPAGQLLLPGGVRPEWIPSA